MELTKEYLLHLFDYDREHGKLIWKNPLRETKRGIKTGKVVGIIKGKRFVVPIGDRKIGLCHIVWFLETGKWPVRVTHKNGFEWDTRFENLKPFKSRTPHTNTQYPGTFYEKSRDKWVAEITYNNKKTWLGRFDTQANAHVAYKKALAELNEL